MLHKRLLVVTFLTLISVVVHGDTPIPGFATACLLRENGYDHAPDLDSITAENYASSEICLRHWNKPMVTVSLIGDDGKRKPPTTRRMVKRAAELWNRKMESTVQLLVVDDPIADVTIRFVSGSQLPNHTSGRTEIAYQVLSGTLCSASIQVESGLKEDNAVQAVAHELGHALGIQGHSPNREDLMFEKSHLPAVVTQRDANTLCIAYGRATMAGHPETAVSANVSR